MTSPLIAGAAALIGSGIISGQASRATMNMLNGQAWNTGLFQLSDMLVDGALSILPFKLFGGSLAKFGAQGLRFGNQTVAAAKNAFNNLQNWVTNNFDLGAVTSGGLPVPRQNLVSGIQATEIRGLVQNRAISELRYGEIYNALQDAGLSTPDHFVQQLMNPRTSRLGVNTLADLQRLLNYGVLESADNGMKALIRGNLAVIIDPATGNLITIRPWP